MCTWHQSTRGTNHNAKRGTHGTYACHCVVPISALTLVLRFKSVKGNSDPFK